MLFKWKNVGFRATEDSLSMGTGRFAAARLAREVRKQWFLLGIVLVVAGARHAPWIGQSHGV